VLIYDVNNNDVNLCSIIKQRVIEYLWSIIKRRVYADGKQYTSKDALWKAIKQELDSIPISLIGKLRDSVNERLFDIIRLNRVNNSLSLAKT
jgi:hypothetical protein